ncbi:excisionase family DNA-binding protein [Demequina iriomotensis]|uniref:excisionase family DNA-binding protein n=1 Tax=Demequina iriomotensis TaxID=1536641 RepID=UPI00078129FC|nr:helix-turn-helix domain-containing protein [Demequina iriomotensis]
MQTSTHVDLDEIRKRPTITVTEAGQLLGVSRGSAYDAVRDGTIPSIRVGRRYVIPTARFLALIGADN